MKQWDMRHIGIFDINFDTGEYYWSAELRRILRVPDGMPPEFLILLQHVHPDDRRRWLPSRWSLCKESVRHTAPSSIVCSIQMALCVGCTSKQAQLFVLAANATPSV